MNKRYLALYIALMCIPLIIGYVGCAGKKPLTTVSNVISPAANLYLETEKQLVALNHAGAFTSGQWAEISKIRNDAKPIYQDSLTGWDHYASSGNPIDLAYVIEKSKDLQAYIDKLAVYLGGLH